MLDAGQFIIKQIEKAGYKAYLVGGFVRDYCMHRDSFDVDICTDATPKQLSDIFDNLNAASEQYGSVTLLYKNIHFEITTFRIEDQYVDSRHPGRITYIHDLLEDLKRRDFTINTLCMDTQEGIVDLLGGMDDIENRMIRVVGSANRKLCEDALRIMRAVRFATVLDFHIDRQTRKYMKKHAHYLRNISFLRKKQELEKIFSSPNRAYGISLINELGIGNELGLSGFKTLVMTDDVLGLWGQLDGIEQYPFTKNERQLIKSVKRTLSRDLFDPYLMYQEGLYIITVTGEIKGISRQKISELYDRLPIKKRSDLAITTDRICEIFQREPGPFLQSIYQLLERQVITGVLGNHEEDIEQYLKKKYKEENF